MKCKAPSHMSCEVQLAGSPEDRGWPLSGWITSGQAGQLDVGKAGHRGRGSPSSIHCSKHRPPSSRLSKRDPGSPPRSPCSHQPPLCFLNACQLQKFLRIQINCSNTITWNSTCHPETLNVLVLVQSLPEFQNFLLIHVVRAGSQQLHVYLPATS